MSSQCRVRKVQFFFGHVTVRNKARTKNARWRAFEIFRISFRNFGFESCSCVSVECSNVRFLVRMFFDVFSERGATCGATLSCVLWEGAFGLSVYYESQPVGLAEVVFASEASLGGPGGRPSQMYKNRVK